MFDSWKNDAYSIMSRDPAARSMWEVILFYPSFKAMRRHRRAHKLWNKGHKLWARMVSQRTRKITGIEIHPGAKIGANLFIDHGSGVVIGETVEIGDNVTIYQGVTLGGTGKTGGKRHPTIGSNVVIGAGAKVLGPFTVGDNSKIGSGAIVLKEVPQNCTVVGNPGRIVRRDDKKVDEIDLNQVDLPDPVKDRLELLTARIDFIEDLDSYECTYCKERGSLNCVKVQRKEKSHEAI